MKKILNGPTVYRAKCYRCDCEFEYDISEVHKKRESSIDIFEIVDCPVCHSEINHRSSSKSTTSLKREETMST